jgi:hypothetical protein
MNDPETIQRARELAKEIIELAGKEIMEELRPQLINDVAKGVFRWIAFVQRQSPDLTREEIEALWFEQNKSR